MRKVISFLCTVVLLASVACSQAFAAESIDYTGEWTCVAVDEGDGVLKDEYDGAKAEDVAVLRLHQDGTLEAAFRGTKQNGAWEKIEGGVRITIEEQPALDFLLIDGQLVVENGMGDTFYLSRTEEEIVEIPEVTVIETVGTGFAFSRNGITWTATPEQVRKVEGVKREKDYWVHRNYPDYQLLDIRTAMAAGVQAYSLNYLFHKDELLAIYYDFVSWESGNAAKRNRLLAAMTRKYGEPMPAEADWVTQTLSNIPEEIYSVFPLDDFEHQTWMLHEDTVAFLITYNKEGGFALVYVNRNRLAELGILVKEPINLDGI